MSSGGGKSSQPASQTVTQTNIPDWMRPQMEQFLGAAGSNVFQYGGNDANGLPTITGYNPYPQYTGQAQQQAAQTAQSQIAGQTNLQQQANQGAAGLGPNPFSQASGLGMLGTAAAASNYGNNYQPGQFYAGQVQAPQLNNYGMNAAAPVGTQSWTQQGAADAYMSPYTQQVVENQQRDAQRQADIATTQRNAGAVKQGAFGGSRQAVMDAEAGRNLALQKGDIQAAGLQGAYSQGMGQFNAEQGMGLQANLANQGTQQQANTQNLNSYLQTQALGAGNNMQAQLANQQQGLNAQQLGEQSRQYGAGLGLQGLQTAQQGYAGANTAGQNIFNQQTGALGLQNQLGSQQQQTNQNFLNAAYQNFMNQQQYPQQQLSWYSNILRGLPNQAQTQTGYQAPPSPLSVAGGIGTAAYALGRANGGVIRSYKKGGLVSLAMQRIMQE